MNIDVELLYDTEDMIIVLWNLFSAVFGILFLLYIWQKAPKSKSRLWYSFVHILVLIWLVGKVGKTMAPDLTLRWSFNVIYYIGVIFLSPTFLLCVLQIQGRVFKRWWLAIYGVPLLMLLFLLTNPIHYLFYAYYNFIEDDFGPAFFVHAAYTYTCVVLACGLLIYNAVFNRKKESLFLVAAGLVPMVANILYISRTLVLVFDYTPIAYNFSMIILGYALFKDMFLNAVPDIAIKAIESLPLHIRICDSKNSIDLGRICKGQKNKKQVGKLKVEYTYDTAASEAHNILLEKQNEEMRIMNNNIEAELENAREMLKLKEQGRMAAEIHDILGHSLIVSLKLLQNAKADGSAYNKNTQKMIHEILHKGHIDIIASLESRKESEHVTIIDKIYELFFAVKQSGVFCDLIVDDIRTIPGNLNELMFRIIRESLTNSIKHGNADTFTAAIFLDADTVRLLCINNGSGLDSVEYGNGMTHIRDAVKSVSGRMSIESEADSKGFQLQCVLPVDN